MVALGVVVDVPGAAGQTNMEGSTTGPWLSKSCAQLTGKAIERADIVLTIAAPWRHCINARARSIARCWLVGSATNARVDALK